MSRSAIIEGGVVVNIIVGSLPGSVACDDSVGIGWAYDNGEFSAPEAQEPAPESMPPRLTLYAGARLVIADGDISGIDVNSRFAGAFRADVGQYWVFFTETQADTAYLALCYAGGPVAAFVREEDKFEDFFVISVTDMAGDPIDAGAISLEIKRVN